MTVQLRKLLIGIGTVPKYAKLSSSPVVYLVVLSYCCVEMLSSRNAHNLRFIRERSNLLRQKLIALVWMTKRTHGINKGSEEQEYISVSSSKTP